MTATEAPEPARLLVAAEREVAGRRARDVVASTLGAALVADTLAVLALLLPWAGAVEAPITGLQVSFTFTGVVLVGIVLRQVVLRAAVAAPDASSYPMVILVAALSTIAGVAVWVEQPRVVQTLAAGEVSRLPPLAFAVAFLSGGGLACLAAARTRRVIDDVDLLKGTYVRDPELLRERFAGAVEDALRHPRGATNAVPAGVAGLLLATAGLLAPWQRQAISLLRPDSPAYLATAAGLPQTLVLRWTVAIALVATLAVVATPRLARMRPVTLIMSGAAILVHTVRYLASDSSPLAIVGPLFALEGSWLAVVAGVIAIVRRPGVARPHRTTLAVATGVALVIAGSVVIPVDGLATAAPTSFPGTPTVYSDEDDEIRPTIAVAEDGQIWTLHRVDDEQTLLGRITAGRFVATTRIRTPRANRVDLLAITRGHAVLEGDNRYRSLADGTVETGYVSVVSLRARDAAVGPAARTATPEVSRTVLRGYVGDFAVRPVVDGSFVMIVRSRTGPRDYLVAAADAVSRPRWPRNRPLAAQATDLVDDSLAFGPGGARLTIGTSHGSRAWLSGAAGHGSRVLIGGVSDLRCSPSRDPLSTHLDYDDAYAAAAVDRRGNLWINLPTGDRDQLAVRTPDGVLRTVPTPAGPPVVALSAAPDGSLLLTRLSEPAADEPVVSTTRIAGAERSARRASPLPRPRADCLSENRVHATVSGAGVQTVPGGTVARAIVNGAATQLVVAGADGTVIWARPTPHDPSTVAELVRSTPGRAPTPLAGTDGNVLRLVADGRGGAWWLLGPPYPTTAPLAYTVWHVDAGGELRLMAPPVVARRLIGQVGASVDTADGSLLWRLGGSGEAWRRTTLARRTATTSYTGSEPAVAGRTGFAPGVRGGVLLHDLRRVRVLVGARDRTARLSVLAAAAGRAPLALVSRYARAVVTRRGRVVLVDHSGIGRVDGNRLTLLGGPGERLPMLGASITIIGDYAYYVGADGLVHKVRVS